MFAFPADVRALGGLPAIEKMGDSVIQPHLDSAGRELTDWIGPYSTISASAIPDVREAECCLCMYYLLPSCNTFFTEGVTSIRAEVEDLNFQFYSPSQLALVRASWLERAKSAIARINSKENPEAFRMYAI